MKRWTLTALSICLTLSAANRPEDMSIAAFEAFSKSVDGQVERALAGDFTEREKEIARLAKPFKVGEVVTISIRQGTRYRQETGRFRGVKGQHAEIGDRKVLLSDVGDVDRDRLYFADNPAMLQVKLEQMRDDLEQEKQKRREILRKRMLRRAGYTKSFFDSSTRLGDRFWLFPELGDRTIRISVTNSDREDFVTVVVENRSGTATAALVLFRDQPVATTLTGDAFEEETWTELSFRLDKADLGEAGDDGIGGGLRLWLMKEKVGNWQLMPKAVGRPSRGNATEAMCDECLGSGVVDGQPCPSCGGSGKVARDPFQVTRTGYLASLMRTQIKHNLSTHERRFVRQAQLCAGYQDRIDAKLGARQQKARELRLAREAAVREAEELKRKQQEEIEQRKQLQKRVDNAFLWLTAEDAATDDSLAGTTPMSNQKYDDFLAPRVLREEGKAFEVLGITDWERGESGLRRPGREPFSLYRLKFRILKIGDEIREADPEAPDAGPAGREGGRRRGPQMDFPEEDMLDAGGGGGADDAKPDESKVASRYLVQYLQKFSNNESTPLDLKFTATLVFRNGKSLTWDEKFVTPPKSSKPILSAREVPLEQLAAGVKSLEVGGSTE